jgi:hypothetical protein
VKAIQQESMLSKAELISILDFQQEENQIQLQTNEE